MLPYEQKKVYLLNSVSIGTMKCLAVSTVTTRARMLYFDTDTAP